MFVLNLGHKWTLAATVDPVRGIIFLPSGNSSEKLLRSSLPEATRVLLDPQLYLAELDANVAPKVCARLASYEWFQVPGIPSFESSEKNRTDWEKEVQGQVTTVWPGQPPSDEEKIRDAVAAAINFQLEISCSHIILPTPLIAEREDEAAIQAVWLDHGLAKVEELEVGQPVLATVAVSESALNDGAFAENGFLDTIVDQVVSRNGLNGTYIVIAQTHARHPFETSMNVSRGYLHLCRAFGQRGYDTVLANFVDVLGLACMAVGATGFASGQSSTLRRLSLAGFREGGGGGKNLPHFYSHKIVGELLSETDLDLLVKKRLVGRIRDRTPYSQALLAELARGGSAANLPPWAESHMNTGAACKHFIHRLAEEAAELARLDPDERENAVQEWLENAVASGLFMARRLKGEKLKGRLAPAEMWLDAFSEATSSEEN